MPKLYKYRKFIDQFTTHTLLEPDYVDGGNRITELCTIGNETFVSVPDGVKLPAQSAESFMKEVILDDNLKTQIEELSEHVQLIEQRVRDRIGQKYPFYEELKIQRKRDKDATAFKSYDDYVEVCVSWGKTEKARLGL